MRRGGAALAARAACCVAAAGVAAYVGYLLLAPTGIIKRTASIKEGLTVAHLPGTATFALLLTWASLLGASLATLALRRIGGPLPASAGRSGWATQARRALAWQLPPRAFLAGWCGGLSAGEALGVLAWLALNAWWLGSLLHRSLRDGMTTTQQADKVALALGKMMAPNLMLLFLPLPHCSFITALSGVSRARLVRYHRWLGHGTLWVLTLHGTGEYLVWGMRQEFWPEFWKWSGKINNLAGSIAYCCVLALWLSSLETVRRRMYQLFFRLHIACFLGFMLFACAHYPTNWLYFAPGLLLYAADVALRAGQLTNSAAVTAAVVDERAGTATLQLQADRALTHKPLSEVSLVVPQLSRWQSHSFSVASGGAAGPTLTLHVKRYGAFTAGLLEGLLRRRITSVRLAGPHGCTSVLPGCQLSPPDSWLHYDSLLLIGGGVGVTGLLSLLRSLAVRHAAGQREGLPRSVHFVWAARRVEEFGILDAPLLQAATSPSGWLTIALHVTGGAGGRSGDDSRDSLLRSSTSLKDLSLMKSGASLEASDSLKYSAPEMEAGAGEAAAAHAAPGGPRSFLSRLCYWRSVRPVQPQCLGVAHLSAVYLLTYSGAVGAALLAASYAATVPIEQRWKGGMVYAVAVSAAAVLAPLLLAVLPVHAYRRAAWGHWRATCPGEGDGAQAAVPYSRTARLLDSQCLASKVSVSVGDASIQAQRGRPDLAAELLAASAQAGARATVGVYAGGPKGLMTAVHLALSSLNDEAAARAGAYLDLHRCAVEL